MRDAFLEMSESEWDGQLFRGKHSLAKMCGFRTYHTLRSKGSAPGYVDRTCVRERILFVETKSERGETSTAQIGWLDALASAGGEVYVWLPSDIEEVGKVLGYRWKLIPHAWAGEDRTPTLSGTGAPPNELWRPGSLWIAGQGRWDGRKI